MKLAVGQIVCSLAGRDKGFLFTVLAADDRYVALCNGKERKLSAPKKKKRIHVEAFDACLSADELKTDKSIRKALRSFAERASFPCEEVLECQNRT